VRAADVHGHVVAWYDLQDANQVVLHGRFGFKQFVVNRYLLCSLGHRIVIALVHKLFLVVVARQHADHVAHLSEVPTWHDALAQFKQGVTFDVERSLSLDHFLGLVDYEVIIAADHSGEWILHYQVLILVLLHFNKFDCLLHQVEVVEGWIAHEQVGLVWIHFDECGAFRVK